LQLPILQDPENSKPTLRKNNRKLLVTRQHLLSMLLIMCVPA